MIYAYRATLKPERMQQISEQQRCLPLCCKQSHRGGFAQTAGFSWTNSLPLCLQLAHFQLPTGDNF